MKYYLSVKRIDVLIHAIAWKNLGNGKNLGNVLRQDKVTKYHILIISFTLVIHN